MQPVSLALLNQSGAAVQMELALPDDVDGYIVPAKQWHVTANTFEQDEIKLVISRQSIPGLRLDTTIIATWTNSSGDPVEQRIPVTVRRPLDGATPSESTP